MSSLARLALPWCLSATAALAQTAPPAIDPTQPLPPLPDLGVAWPTPDAPPADPSAPAPSAETTLAYRTEATGLEPVGLVSEFRALSTLRSAKEPANLGQIDLRARSDVALIERLLRSRGYFAGVVTYMIRPAPAAGGEATVAIAVVPGPVYKLTDVAVTTPPGAPREIIIDELSLASGVPLDAATVLAATDRVRLGLPNQGYPFATVGEPDVVVDHDRRAATYALEVDPGPLTTFGGFALSGEPNLGAEHYDVVARFRPGERYDQALVDDFRRALIATSLFSSVTVTPRRAAAGTADLEVAVAPAPPRTVAGEIGYDTEDGFRIEASWRHRNLLPPEGAVTFRGVLGDREQSVGSDLVRSNWRRRDQYLLANVSVARLRTDAFDSTGFQAAGRIERRTTLLWQKPWTYSLGAELVAARERDRGRSTGRDRDFFLAAFPGTLAYDGSDDLLDPTRGFRLSGRLSPETSLQGDFAYARARIDGSAYFSVGGRTVLAGRAALGAIAGAPRATVPPSRRWYVGGGGSVRGYGFQDIGPKDEDGDPLGGRSFTEVAVEARIRVTDTIGVVPFFDAGALYTTSYPGIDDLQYGAGIGARYYTSFGPIRFDVATPVNGRRGDPDVAVYVSIGQAF